MISLILCSLISLVLGNTPVIDTVRKCQPRCIPIDVYILFDGSTSMNDVDYSSQMAFLKRMIIGPLTPYDEDGDPPLGWGNSGDRIAMAQFSGRTEMTFEFEDGPSFIAENIDDVVQLTGATHTDEAINFVINDWDQQADPQDDRQKVLLIVTDGVANPEEYDPCKNSKIKNKLNQRNIDVYIFAMPYDEAQRATGYSLACLVDEPAKHVVFFDDKFDIMSDYRDPTEGDGDLFCMALYNTDKPEQNIPDEHLYQCGPRCYPVDIYFLIDSSGSVKPHSWKKQLEFVYRLVKFSLDHERDDGKHDRVGMVNFGGKTDPVKMYTFDDGFQAIYNSLLSTKRVTGATRTSQGIDKVLELWDDESTAEWNRKKLLVIITDGEPNPDEFNPCNEGMPQPQRLKDLGIETVIFGMPWDAALRNAPEYIDALACLVEDPDVNIVSIQDEEHFSDYKDPTGDQNILCVGYGVMQTPILQLGGLAVPQKFLPSKDLGNCMPYENPRPKIKACPDDECINSDCGDKKRRHCLKDKKCKWAGNECISTEAKCDGECCCKESMPGSGDIANEMPWGGTQSPDYWYNCIARFCSMYTWMGGPQQCHYEMSYGCGCEAMDFEDCLSDSDCCWSGKSTGCQEVVECPRLTFDQCLENSDRCAPCGGSGKCGYKCKMGPGQNLPGFQSLILDDYCNCKVTQSF